MRTTITIDDKLVDELMKLEKADSRSDAIRRAVEARIRQRKVAGFMKLAGQYPHLHTEAERARKISLADAKRTHR
ncbi:MAG: CopG family ribbon-helix-helix protein [Opitutaceae bacterium]